MLAGNNEKNAIPFRETHWSQTVFYVEEPFLVEQDTVISGWIKIQPHTNAPR